MPPASEGGEVGAAAALLYPVRMVTVGGAVQGEQVGIWPRRASETSVNGGGDGGGEPRPRVGSMSLSMAISRPLAGRFCRSACDEAWLGMVGGGEVGVMRVARFRMDFAVGAGC